MHSLNVPSGETEPNKEGLEEDLWKDEEDEENEDNLEKDDVGNDNPKSEKTDDKRGQKEEKAEEESDPNQVWLLQCIFVLVSEDNLSIESYNLRWTRSKIRRGRGFIS